MSTIFLSDEEFERIKLLDNDMLLEWANRITIHYWGVPYKFSVHFCKRLKKTYGKFIVQALMDNDIQLKKMILIKISSAFIHKNLHKPLLIEKILKHELCHWYLYVYKNNRGYMDGDEAFEEELLKIDSISQYQLNYGFYRFNK